MRSFLLNLKNEQETRRLGVSLGKELRLLPALVFISGELGAGKTTLLQGLIRELATEKLTTIQSPTYAYMQVYQGEVPIYHFDLYRIDSPDSIFELGLFDHITDEKALRLIEWPERLENQPITPDLKIELTHQGSGRSAVLNYFSPLLMNG